MRMTQPPTRSTTRARRASLAAGAVMSAVGLVVGAAAAAPPAQAAPLAADATPTSSTATTTAPLNVRSGPSASSRRIATLDRGATVRLTGTTRNGFSEIVHEGRLRWVATRYLEQVTRQPADPVNPGRPSAGFGVRVGASFHVQYTGQVGLAHDVDVYNLDGEDTTRGQVAQLKARGVRVVCYLNAGAYEDWRGDADDFPGSVLGRALDGWPGERWLDIRQLDELMPIMAARMDACAAKGFDAVDPDNTDAWQQRTGFSISRDDQVAYHRALADAAHARGLAIGLKNNVEQLDAIGPFVDFAVNEQCGEYNECGAYAPFLASGKPVFNLEYTAAGARSAKPRGMSTLYTDLALSGLRR